MKEAKELLTIAREVLGASRDPLDPKNIKMEVYPEVVDEWVGLHIEMKGDWEDGDDETTEKLKEVVFRHPEFKRAVSKFRGKSMSAPTFEDSPTEVQKRIPIPRSPRDFEDWDVSRGHAWFSMSDR